MNNQPSDATWEELYDSGQLDHQLAHLNLKGAHQVSQRNQNGPPHGLIMRPLLPEQPQHQALVMPVTHHMVKAPGPHSMAIFGNNPSSMLPPNHVTVLNGGPPGNMMQQNRYPINQHINTNPNVQNMRQPNGNGSNAQNLHEQTRPHMPMIGQPHNGYQQMQQGHINHNNVMAQATTRVPNAMPVSHGPPPIQNNLVGIRPPYRSPPSISMGPPERPYQQMPYPIPPGTMLLPHMPLDARQMRLPIDMSVPPPPLPMNGNCKTRALNTNFQNNMGLRGPANKNFAQKQSKNKNSKSNSYSSLSNTQTKQKASSPVQAVFPDNNSLQSSWDVNAAAIAYNSVEVESEYPRTQYCPPEPKVTILKRPVSTPNNLSLQASSSASDNSDEGNNSMNTGGGINNIRTKSLKQREEEYAQARLRILGSTEPETGTAIDTSLNDSSDAPTSQSMPDVVLASKSQSKNKLAAGASLTVISNPTSTKSISSKKCSNSNFQSEVKEICSSKEPNVGQGRDS